MTLPENEFENRPELRRKRAISIALQRLVIVLVSVYLIGSVSILVVNSYIGAKTRATLIDCTDPEGKCYQEGQKRSAKLIGSIFEVIIASDACSLTFDTFEEIQKCVEKKVNENGTSGNG